MFLKYFFLNTKREKVRQIHSYPFLLPKTYSEPYDYDYSWFKDQLFKCDVQVVIKIKTL